MRTIIGTAVAAAAASLLAACSGSATAPTSTSSGTHASTSGLTVVYPTAIATLDPAQICDIPTDTVVRNFYDQLVQQSVQGSISTPAIKPDLATSWKSTDGGTRYIFDIRHGVTFHSGNPLTAADVVFSYDRALKAQGCPEYTTEGGLFGNIKAVRAVSKYQVEFDLKRVDPRFPSFQYVVCIIDKKVLLQNGGLTQAGNTWMASHEAGSGPFVLKSYDPSAKITATANPHYWQYKVASGKLTYLIATNPTQLALIARTGQADLVYGVALNQVDSVAKQSGMRVITAPGLSYISIGLNEKHSPLNKLAVRQALAYATPFDQIRQTLAGRYGIPFVGPILKGELFYKPYTNPYPYSIAKAKTALTQAGIKKLSLTIDVVAGASDQQQIATILQSSWAQAGITLHIQTMGSSAWTKAINAFQDDLYITQDKSDVPDPAFMLGYYVHCQDPFNWTAYCNATVNRDLETARFEKDVATRAQLYNQLSLQVVRDVAYLEMYQMQNVVLAPSGITNYVSYVNGMESFGRVGVR